MCGKLEKSTVTVNTDFV